MRIALAQTKNILGDLKGNSQQILSCIQKSKNKADLLLFPEGGLLSYPAKDWLFQKKILQLQEKTLQQIHQKIPENLGVLLPAFISHSSFFYNGVFLLEKNKKPQFFKKAFLSDDTVFYESRYFKKGSVKDNVFFWKKKKIQILICEDLWQVKTLDHPDLILSLNASPYTNKKQKNRFQKIQALVKKYQCPAFYLNCVGAQDEILFDGGSFVLNSKGSLSWLGAFFEPDFKIYDLKKPQPIKKKFSLTKEESYYKAIVMGIKDFFDQLNFSKAHIGLSGGMDSALVLYLAVKALGKKQVKAYFLPSPFTHKISYTLTKELSELLQVHLKTIDISPIYKKIMESLFPRSQNPVTSQNIQARIRSLILMAEANENSSLLLGTGNKSELATGYSTLYGDLSGALLPIGDLWKTEVYDLAKFINKKTLIFPKKLILRPPTAELALQQTDENDLPPYKELDPLLEKLLQFKPAQTKKEKKMALLLQKSEFKRKQSPPILKLSPCAFGEGRRMPIAHKFPI